VAELDDDRLLGVGAHGHHGGGNANQKSGQFHVFSSRDLCESQAGWIPDLAQYHKCAASQ
jgi:hypothetical protein